MVTIIHGRIQGGVVIPDAPLDMPDGLEVEVQITARDVPGPSELNSGSNIESLFGIWRDRGDMADSTAWVRKQRDEWQNRLLQSPD